MRRTVLLAAAALAMAIQPAAAQLPCLDAATTRAAADLALPALMTAVSDKCGGEYAAYAPTIAANRGALAGRFQRNADAAWPVVRDWVLRSHDPRLDQARRELARNENFARAIVTAYLSTEVGGKLDARSCAAVETVMRAVLPLSNYQIGEIGAAMVRLALLDRRVADAGVNACPPGPPPR